ncbi:MAG TPA: hypothetical protein PKZ76_03415 [Xanthomonadaceae bacterium]|nr:hypothetical protein [Xanthomonadaceae bacterium]
MTQQATTGVPELVIRSEDDAWNALAAAVAGKEFSDDIRLRFEGWPRFELDFKGRDWNSTVPTRIMPALLDVQRDINRAYATIEYREPNLRRLRDEERDRLEVVVQVKKGSSVFNADLWPHFSRIAEAAVGRMSGDQIVVTVLGLALTIMAPVMFKAWLRARQEEKETASRVELSKQETERLKVMKEAITRQPALEASKADAEATANKLLKASKPGDTMEISGVSVSAEEAREIVQPERERATELEIEGAFAVLGNRTDKGDGFRITIRRQRDGLTFNADVPLELPAPQQKVIQDAEWSKRLVRLIVDAEMLRDSITRAVVISASEVETDS